MERKCSTLQYRIQEEFRADAQLIVHNIVIYHGGRCLVARQCDMALRDMAFNLTGHALRFMFCPFQRTAT